MSYGAGRVSWDVVGLYIWAFRIEEVRNFAVPRTVLRRRGRQKTIGGTRPRLRLEALTRERAPPELSLLRGSGYDQVS